MTVCFKKTMAAIFAVVLLCSAMSVFASATETTDAVTAEASEVSTINVDESEGSAVAETTSAEENSVPDTLKESNNTNVGFWIGLGAVALGSLVALVFVIINKKNEDE